MLDPKLRDVPVAVAGSPKKRHGVVLAKNELAKKAGVRTGDVIWEAKLKEPALVLVEPHFDLYSKYSRQVFDLYTRYTCYVEPFGPDECWLDVTGSVKLFGGGVQIADTLRRVVKDETGGLTLSAGVSFCKVFSKIASDLKKPDATTEVTRQNFKQIIWPLPVSYMLMVGGKTTEKFTKLNIRTIGALAAADENVLKSILGANGVKLIRNAAGFDDEPVREYVKSRDIKSVGHGMTAVKDIRGYGDAEAMLFYLADKIAVRMRRYGVRAGGIAVDLRDANLQSITRQCKLPAPVRNATDIGRAAAALTRENWDLAMPLRTLTVSAFDLTDAAAPVQASMFAAADLEKNDRLDLALDKIRDKYGSSAILRANLIERDFIYDKTDDEDFLPFKR
jgi:DNA polymerase-4